MRLFDFRCVNGHVTEQLVASDARTSRCRECDAHATRIISPVRCKLDSTFPGEAIKWAKAHEQGAKVKAE